MHRGMFDAALRAVLTIEFGDVVEVTTLSGSVEDLPGARSGFHVLPEHQAVLAGTAPGEGPHFINVRQTNRFLMSHPAGFGSAQLDCYISF